MSKELSEEEWKQLLSDVRHNRVEAVTEAIRDVDSETLSAHIFGGRKSTLVYEAARLGNEDVLKLLLDKGVDPNVPDRVGCTAIDVLPLAMNTEQIARHNRMVKALLDAGAHNADEEAKTDLMRAIREQNVDKVKKLIAEGADVNAQDRSGRPVWDYALRTNNQDIMKALIDGGVDLEAKNQQGHTALIAAVYDSANYKEMAKFLLENGADVNGRASGKVVEGKTPLFFARDAELTDILIKAGADVRVKDAHGRTAVWGVSADCLRVLKEAGADLTVTDAMGRTLMHDAALAGDFTRVQFLQGCGLDINGKDKEGWTPLMYAAVGKNDAFIEKGLLKENNTSISCIEQMIAAGADVTAKNNNMQTAIDLADDKVPEVKQFLTETYERGRRELVRNLSVQEKVTRRLGDEKVQKVLTYHAPAAAVETEKTSPVSDMPMFDNRERQP